MKAPRCPLCCVHGRPYATAGWCGWCEDTDGGYADRFDDDEPMWLCPHGIGRDIWAHPQKETAP